ncbi:MAG: HlyD family type I secretion periplasmic adaptor subunit [Pseudomonadota bacterium]
MVDEKEFMSELEAAARIKPSFSSNFLLIAVLVLVGSMIAWAYLSEVEEITRGSGQVVPSSEIQIVQSLEGGILDELLVKEGDQVEKDQVLLRIKDLQFSAEGRGTEAEFLALKAKRDRLTAEANGTALKIDDEIVQKAPEIARNETALYRSRQQELENAKSILDSRISSANAELSEVGAKINRLSESRKLLQQELEITKEMVRKRAVPKLDEIRLNREVTDISGQINEAVQRRRALNADLAAAKKERQDQEAKFKSQALGELNEVETQISQLSESLTTIEDRVFRTEVRSPVEGIINKITIKTKGGIIEPAMQLAEVVPLDDELKIVARVAPHEIAFLKLGQEANIKISAYDSQRYGSLKGALERIGANSVTDGQDNVFFEIELKAEKNFLGTEENPLPITTGMVADVEVITGKRTILDYLLKPVLRAKDKALTER